MRSCASSPSQTDWELVLLRTRTLGGRPALPRALRGRVHVRTALDAEGRAAVLRDAAVFVPAFDGYPRVTIEAQAAGAAVSAPPHASSPSSSRQRPRG